MRWDTGSGPQCDRLASGDTTVTMNGRSNGFATALAVDWGQPGQKPA